MEFFGDAVILCGGKSKRMGFDKAFLKINGKYILETIAEKLSLCFGSVRLCADSADSAEKLKVFGLELIIDLKNEGIGPAVGIYTALSQAQTAFVFVTACDMPLLDVAHIGAMKRALAEHAFLHDALIPMNGAYIEPLYSFYAAGLAGHFAEEIGEGNYKIHNILKKCNTLYFPDPSSRVFDKDLRMFTNINNTNDLEWISWILPSS